MSRRKIVEEINQVIDRLVPYSSLSTLNTAKEKIMVTEQEYVEPSESMKAFLSGYCYAGICWVCGARLKEKGATVCPGGAHKSKDRKEEE